jgi:hypothetical protein
MYIAVHLFYLGGVGGRRIGAGMDAISSLFGSRQSRVMHGELEGVERPTPEPPPPRRPAATPR